ncbi:MAG: tRNA (adenosine(37)-N6)-dimethylallyltransferase MiaA, partial [Armatimonadetes bacterium]|nr:tRNA (adenosine(37)-N6)-dimethylallyltransferase MiaA [Armatimonadota bacterium]
YLKKQSKDFLCEELRKIDPQALKSIYPNDKLRIIRAIEIKKGTGKSISEFKKLPSNPLECKIIKIGLIKERNLIYQNINSRVDEMIKNGLLEEISDLIKRGYKETLRIKKIMGYTEFIPYFDGTYNLNEAIELFKKHTRNYAKRQITWFKKDFKINWINLSHFEGTSLIIKEIKRIIEENI